MKKKSLHISSVPFQIAGTSVGFGLFGEALNSQPLKDAGTAAGKFLVPAITISMSGTMIKQLKKLGRIKHG